MRRAPLVIFLLSAAVLAVEIALTRVFAYLVWYHAVFLIVSMALLGFAASGSLLTLGGAIFQKDPPLWVRLGAALFALFVVLGLFLPHWLPLESESLARDSPMEMRNLAVHFVFWGGTFCFAGLSLALLLQQAREKVHSLYFASLAGSGVGCLLALCLLYSGPVTAIGTMALVSLLAAALVPSSSRSQFFAPSAVLVLALIVPVVFGLIRPVWPVASSKWEFHKFAQGRIERTIWSPISVVEVFRGPNPGWRYWDTGLAVHRRGDFPDQMGIIIDAYAMSSFTNFSDGDFALVDFFPSCSTSAAYVLRERPRSLVIGVGGGIDVLRALFYEARRVVGVELNGVLVDLLRGPYSEYTGGLSARPGVSLVKDEGRSFVKHSREEFDIIQINYTDTWSASSAGALALAENFLYTAEAVRDYLGRLSPDGVLSITRTLSRPWGEAVRVILTVLKALRDQGVADPERHILGVASIMADAPQPHMSFTLLVCRRPFTTEEADRLAEAGRGKWLMLIRPDGGELPEVTDADAPLYKGENYLVWAAEKINEARVVCARFIAASRDEKELAAALAAHPVDVSPLTDDRPFFYFSHWWRDVWSRFIGGEPIKEGAVLFSALALALTCSVLGIFIPLIVWQIRVRRRPREMRRGTVRFALYFGAIGFGYIAIELNLIQKYALFMGHPVYALGVILAGLLIMSGIGSGLSAWMRWSKVSLAVLFLALAAVAAVTMSLSGVLFDLFAGRSLQLRAAAMLAVLAPLGILMGMPFPIGLRRAGLDRSDLIPWLWGINGFTSVIGSIGATMLAIAFGYNSATVAGIAAYLIALLAAGRIPPAITTNNSSSRS
jgi:hypothetical protein